MKKKKSNYKPPKKVSDSSSDSSSDEKAKQKKKKAKKDPNAPKKNLNAYMIYAGENRADLKKKQPDLKAKEVASALGLKWGKLTEDEKKPYMQKAAADKVRYEQETAKYLKSKK